MSLENKETQYHILEVDGLTKSFGGVHALSGFNMKLDPGSLLGLIGPNGAGKTTVFNLLSGVISPTAGTIIFLGQDITNIKPHKRGKLGLTRTFQNIRLFEELTVLDNVKVALHMHHGKGLFQTLLHSPGYVKSEKQITKQAEQLLELLHIEKWRDEKASLLPHGIQRSVEIARAIATEPKVLLLDEPVAGLNPSETEAFIELITGIHRNFDFSILLVEHDMKVIMSMCNHILVLDQGELIAEGSPSHIQNNPKVIKAYLGYEKG